MNTLSLRRTALSAAVALSCVLSLPAFAAVSVTVSPKNASVPASGQQQFFADVPGGVTRQVTWLVNGVPGGAPSIGTISDQGVYTAPAGEADAVSATVSAVSQEAPLAADSASVAVAAPTVTGPTFYVATNGNDSANGSASSPWKTIQHAMDVVPAGGTVQVAGGVYKELVRIKRSGSASAGYTTLMSAPHQTAIIDGDGLTFKEDARGLVTLQDVSYVRVVGLELRKLQSTDAAKTPAGILVQSSSNNSVGHIEIRHNHINKIETTIPTSAGNAFGLVVYGLSKTPMNYVIVDSNTLDTLTLGYSESLTINGNVTNWQVTNNTISGNNNIGIDAIGYENKDVFKSDPELDRARNGWIAGNKVSQITSTTNPAYDYAPGADGIYVDGGKQITIERNTVTAADIGIELASEHGGKSTSQVLVRNNIVRDSLVVGLTIGGYKANKGGTEQCTVVNNTFFNNDTSASGTGEFQIQYNAKNNTFANNIFYANDSGLAVNSFVADGAKTASLRNDLYFASSGESAVNWLWQKKTYETLAAFQKGSGTETQGLVADPAFFATATQDLNISPDSPAVGQGVNLGPAVVGTVDLAGKPRTAADGSIDSGALQH